MTKLQKQIGISYFCIKYREKLTTKETYKHSIPIQIRFSDIDALSHVNNSFHSQYYDLGRIHYFEEVMKEKINWTEIVVVIVHIEIDFISPILQADNIDVETKLFSFGEKSMKMHQQLIDNKTGIIKSKCTTILSGFNSRTNTSVKIPEDFKTKFLEFEA